MFSGQNPPLITAFAANCTELAQRVESLARHPGCWQSSERLLQPAERGRHPQKVIQPVLTSVCGTGRGWLMLPRCLTPSLAKGRASTGSQAGWAPPYRTAHCLFICTKIWGRQWRIFGHSDTFLLLFKSSQVWCWMWILAPWWWAGSGPGCKGGDL